MATLQKRGILRQAQDERAPALGGLPALLALCALTIGVAALLPLVQIGGATTTAGNIQRLKQEKLDLQAQLRQLEVEVAELGSLGRIEREARLRLGMGPPVEEVVYITVPVPPPEARRLPSRFLPPDRESAESGSSLWDDLLGLLP